MAFADVFYSDNPKRRDKVVAKYERIICCMRDNFFATNRMVSYLQQNFTANSGIGRIVHGIPELKIKEGQTIKENCDFFLREVSKLQQAVAMLDDQLAHRLDPVAYQALRDPSRKFKDVIGEVKKSGKVVESKGIAIGAMIAIYCISSGAILTSMVESMGMIATCGIAYVGVVLIGIGIDMIFSAIIGAVERSMLENCISELERVLSAFEPATREYTGTIYEVLGAIRNL